MEKNNRFLICALAIFVSYFYFGILQEKITKGKYEIEVIDKNGHKVIEKENFTYAFSLVFVQCLINYCIAKVAVRYWSKVEDRTSVVYSASVAMTYLLAMVCSNMALQWVSYPTQVVGKSAKPIPVMILGALVGRKQYPTRKYFFIFLIVLGVVMFMLKDNTVGKQKDSPLGLGELLLVLSLTMDGLTGAIQERIRAEFAPSGYQLMKTSNAWSCIYLSTALILTGEGFKFMDFAGRHPSIIFNLLILGITQGIGQIFLYSMVTEFGPLVVSVVTTSRKFFTVLFSVIIFGNVLTTRQWIGACMVFSGLLLDAYYSKKRPVTPETSLHALMPPLRSSLSVYHLQSDANIN